MPNLIDRLNKLREPLAIAAQAVVDDWEQDEHGIDPDLGTGGVCDRVAAGLGDVIGTSIRDIEIDEGGQYGDDHASLIVYNGVQAATVDVPCSLYERGGGYVWRKVAGATIRPSDIVIEEIRRSDVTDRKPDIPVLLWEDGSELRRVPQQWWRKERFAPLVKGQIVTWDYPWFFLLTDQDGESSVLLPCRFDTAINTLRLGSIIDLTPENTHLGRFYKIGLVVEYLSKISPGARFSAHNQGEYACIMWWYDKDRGFVPPIPYDPDLERPFWVNTTMYPKGTEDTKLLVPDEPWLSFGQPPPILWGDDELAWLVETVKEAEL